LGAHGELPILNASEANVHVPNGRWDHDDLETRQSGEDGIYAVFARP
jgi:hypothetical protein